MRQSPTDEQLTDRTPRAPVSSLLRLTAVVALSLGCAVASRAQLASLESALILPEQIAGLSRQAGAHMGDALAVGDFDGDAHDDLVIGLPGSDVQQVRGAGQVVVLYGYTPGGWSRRVILDQWQAGVDGDPQESGGFGSQLVVGDFDGDGIDDLLVGAPSTEIAGLHSAGATHVFYGEPVLGLSGAREERFERSDLTGANQEFAYFGRELASGDFDDDGYDDAVIGTPSEEVQGAGDSGAAYVLHGGPAGLTLTGMQWLTEWHLGAHNGVDDAQGSERFGSALATGDYNGDGWHDLAVGAPGEEFEPGPPSPSHGAVFVLYGSDSGLQLSGHDFSFVDPVLQQSLGRELASGDLNGDGFDELLVGAPLWSEGAVVFGGRMLIVPGSAQGTRFDQFEPVTQSDVGSATESNDWFGDRIVTGDFNADGLHDFAVAAYFEGYFSLSEAGMVSVAYGSSDLWTSEGSRSWHQGVAGVAGSPEAGDRFGRALAVGDFAGPGADLIVGVPDEHLADVSDAGAVHVLFSGIEIFSNGFESGGTAAWSHSAH